MDTSGFFVYPSATVEPGIAPTGGFLEDATDSEWEMLLSYTQTRHLRAGETVITEGDADRAVYLLTAGQLELSAARTPAASVGAPVPVNEIAFLDGGRCTVTARALTDGEVLRLSYDAFESLAAREPTLGRKVLLDLGRIVAGRLRSGGG